MNTPTAPLRLDGHALGRAWWRLPLSMIALLVVLAYVVAALCKVEHLGGWWPLLIAGALSAGGMLNGYNCNNGVWAVLGRRAGVQDLPGDHALTRRVHSLADRLGLPHPLVGVMRSMNAYASGPRRDRSVVVIGIPLVQRLTSEELDAVIGHELGHIATGDVRRMQYGEGFQAMYAGVVGFIVNLGGMIVIAVMKTREGVQLAAGGTRFFDWIGRHVVGFGGQVLMMASSREREFHADAIGAALTSPAAMISALEKLHKADAPPTPAEKDFAYMMFRGVSGSLWATHPTLAQRRAALKGGTYIRKLPRLQQGSHEARCERY